jgi:tetratricopeptide (TPR) repeat protein
MAVAVRLAALAKERMGDVEGALAGAKRCLAISPVGASCLLDEWNIEASEGRCEDAVIAARRFVALQPGSGGAYYKLANALYGAGHPLEAVRDALEESASRSAPEVRKLTREAILAELALLTGDFAAEETYLRDAHRDSEQTSDEQTHFGQARREWSLAFEEGHRDEAIEVATAFLHQRAGWVAYDLFDPSILAYGALSRMQALPRAELDTVRAQWVQRDEQRSTQTRAGGQIGQTPGYRWALAYALPADTAEDARVALEALPRFLPLPDPAARHSDIDGPIGRVYFLAGRTEDALPFLRRAATSCVVLDVALEHTKASLYLADALRALGRNEEACARYAVVLSRWGHANRASRTAKAARDAWRELRCGSQ